MANGWSQPLNYLGDDAGSGGVIWSIAGQEVDSGYAPDNLDLAPGTHNIVATLTNSYGCTFDATVNLTLPELPAASFEMSEPPCNGLQVSFTNLSTDANDFLWTFDASQPWTGGVEESGQVDPTWTYPSFGTVQAQLIAQP